MHTMFGRSSIRVGGAGCQSCSVAIDAPAKRIQRCVVVRV